MYGDHEEFDEAIHVVSEFRLRSLKTTDVGLPMPAHSWSVYVSMNVYGCKKVCELNAAITKLFVLSVQLLNHL